MNNNSDIRKKQNQIPTELINEHRQRMRPFPPSSSLYEAIRCLISDPPLPHHYQLRHSRMFGFGFIRDLIFILGVYVLSSISMIWNTPAHFMELLMPTTNYGYSITNRRIFQSAAKRREKDHVTECSDLAHPLSGFTWLRLRPKPRIVTRSYFRTILTFP